MSEQISVSLTAPQVTALHRMPVVLDQYGCLPPDSPSGAIVKTLERKGLIELRDGAWRATERGAVLIESVEWC